MKHPLVDHDPGDEDRRDAIADACPMCGEKLHHRRVWQTPVMPPMSVSFDDAMAVTPKPSDRWVGEILTTCVDCKGLARRFAELQRIDPNKKLAVAYYRDLERRAGLGL